MIDNIWSNDASHIMQSNHVVNIQIIPSLDLQVPTCARASLAVKSTRKSKLVTGLDLLYQQRQKSFKISQVARNFEIGSPKLDTDTSDVSARARLSVNPSRSFLPSVEMHLATSGNSSETSLPTVIEAMIFFSAADLRSFNGNRVLHGRLENFPYNQSQSPLPIEFLSSNLYKLSQNNRENNLFCSLPCRSEFSSILSS